MKVEKSGNIRKSEVKVKGAEGVGIRWLISKEDGAENFAMRMFELERGGHTPLHTHPHEHEVFIVEGEGVFAFGLDSRSVVAARDPRLFAAWQAWVNQQRNAAPAP